MRPRSQCARHEKVLGAKIWISDLQSNRACGARRVGAIYCLLGMPVRIKRLMRQQALRTWPKLRRMPVNAGTQVLSSVSPNLLNRLSMQATMTAGHRYVGDGDLAARQARGRVAPVSRSSDCWQTKTSLVA